MKGIVCEIDAKTATEFLLPRHYSGRKPTITKAYGWFNSKTIDLDNLKAVCTFGKPASPFVCEGICGKKYADSVYELNRLCRVDDWNEPLSQSYPKGDNNEDYKLGDFISPMFVRVSNGELVTANQIENESNQFKLEGFL